MECVGRVQLPSAYFLLLSLISNSSARLNTFFIKIDQKWKCYKEGKQDFERFLKCSKVKILECWKNCRMSTGWEVFFKKSCS